MALVLSGNAMYRTLLATCGSAEIRCLYTIYIIGINKAPGKFWLKNKNKDKLQGFFLFIALKRLKAFPYKLTLAILE